MTDGENKPSMSYMLVILEESALLVNVAIEGKVLAIRRNESDSILNTENLCEMVLNRQNLTCLFINKVIRKMAKSSRLTGFPLPE